MSEARWMEGEGEEEEEQGRGRKYLLLGEDHSADAVDDGNSEEFTKYTTVSMEFTPKVPSIIAIVSTVPLGLQSDFSSFNSLSRAYEGGGG